MEKDFYKILQIDPLAEPEVVQAAYKRLALKYHPDINKSLDTTRQMQEINEAYAVISDPAKRAVYDCQQQQSESERAYKYRSRDLMVLTLGPDVTMEFVRVPAGKFLMGSDRGFEDEQPPRSVFLDAYYIGKYPVTWAQWAQFAASAKGAKYLNWVVRDVKNKAIIP